jgi:hypothetical protein
MILLDGLKGFVLLAVIASYTNLSLATSDRFLENRLVEIPLKSESELIKVMENGRDGGSEIKVSVQNKSAVNSVGLLPQIFGSLKDAYNYLCK